MVAAGDIKKVQHFKPKATMSSVPGKRKGNLGKVTYIAILQVNISQAKGNGKLERTWATHELLACADIWPAIIRDNG